jgi:hypothetical protein
MQLMLALLSVVFILGGMLWIFKLVEQAKLPKNVRRVLGAGFLLAGFVLIYARILSFAFLALFIGAALVFGKGERTSKKTHARISQVLSDHLEMTLNHDTGDIDGIILTDRHVGRKLSELNLGELYQLISSFRDDSESIRLLETYLNFAHSNWQEGEDWNGENTFDTSRISDGISKDEAYRTLGLELGASEGEIREAHHRLIMRVHPDHGGTAALTAKINEARDRLLRND